MSELEGGPPPGWALATWVGLAAGILSSAVFLSINHRPWLAATAADRGWTAVVGAVVIAAGLRVARSRGLRRSRCGYSVSLFVTVATVVFLVASL